MKAVSVALITLIAAGSASAAEQSPWSVGADLGAQTSRNDGVAGRAYVGYELGSGLAVNREQVHAVELSVFSQGLSNHDKPARATGVAVNWATILKVSDNWSVTARLGADYAWTTTRRSDVWSQTYDKAGLFAGAGVAYTLTPKILVRADVTYMPLQVTATEKSKVPTVTIGVRYGF
jgi:outer membrane protein W